MVEERYENNYKKEEGKKQPSPEQEEEQLSEEDQVLKDNLDMMVERVKDSDSEISKTAIDSIANEIRSATSTMTSVPKPLKFLGGHYAALKEFYDICDNEVNKGLLADVLSVLAMTSAGNGSCETLKYKLASKINDVASWGHEYTRHLAGEIGEEYQKTVGMDGIEDARKKIALMKLVHSIIPWNMAHNAEPEAVDLALEVECLDLILEAIDADNCNRTCLYLLSCASYLPEPEDKMVLLCAFNCYTKVNMSADAMQVALRLGDQKLMTKVFASVSDPLIQKQLAYILGDARVWLEDLGSQETDESLVEELNSIMGNTKLSERYLALARDLDVMEPKTPDDVFKSHLQDSHRSQLDSASNNTAATYVNAFVNAGFGQDKLVTAEMPEEGDNGSNIHWIFRNKSQGKLAAAASLGLIFMWDVEGGLPQVDRFLYVSDPLVVGGALLAFGIIASGVTDEVDPAFAVLSEYVGNEDPSINAGAVWGLGLAYAGKAKADVKDLLLEIVNGDTEVPVERASLAALSTSLSFVGISDGDAVESILQSLMLRGESELDSKDGRMMAHSLGLLFLGRQDMVEATIEVAKTLPEKVSKYASNVLDMCAYAGTGDVLKIQQFLAACGEQIDTEDGENWKTAHQAVAALAIGVVACGEELGSQMAHRALEHVLQYGGSSARKGVSLALAILNVSNPDVAVIDTLGRLSHDADEQVAMSALISLGIVGAGTNNARLAGLLRNLSMYYSKESSMLFLVKISQGLVHAGKGLITFNPFSSSSGAMHRPAMASLLILLLSCLDMKSTIGGKLHYLLFALVAAMRPRMLMTINEEGTSIPVQVRVGAAVNLVAQAGRPKSISGFQTHSTPVLLACNERAELATSKYKPLSSNLEGTVIVVEDPNYVEIAE